MKASETTLQKLLNTSRQFIVPIYQRNYSWEEKQYKQLWLDILRAGNFSSGQTHFIGSIVYIDMGTPAGRPQQLLLIDGQQRLATLSLLLCALKQYIEEYKLSSKIVKTTKLSNQFLINRDEVDNDKYKLILNAQDKDTYINLIEQVDSNELNTNFSKRIIDCYNYFYRQLRIQNLDIDTIYKGILNLSLISISLDKNTDKPQLIFESMNSTGRDLSQADLLRNFLLMDYDTSVQNRLYKTYWQPIEKAFSEDSYLEKFDYFIRDFLTVKRGKICKINDVYETFKRYCLDENQTKEAVLKEIFTYAGYYAAIVLNLEKDKDLAKLWKQLQAIDSHVVYPFFLQLYRDYTSKILSKEDFQQIIQLTINYIVRRAICEMSTSSLNKVFAVFYQKINKNDYVNSVVKEYILNADYRRFPTDYEVREKLQLKDMYHFRLRNYLWESLENYYHKEPINLTKDNYSIEHIMPQNTDLNSDWRKMLGDNWQQIQQIYLHTLGNLTITGYNSEMSNKAFSKKVNASNGLKHSHLQLNQYVANCDVWNKNTIQKRTNLLTDLILKIWQYPTFRN